MVFSDLSVRVNARTDAAERSIDSLGRSVSGLDTDAIQTASALQILQDAVDETDDEMSSLDRETSSTSRSLAALSGAAGTTTGAFGTLSAAGGTLNLTFGSLASTPLLVALPALAAGATALTTTLIPLAAVVGTLTAGVAALAAAFGLVIGSGILAFGERRGQQNQERLDEVNQRIERLEELEETTGELTDAQEEELERLEEQQDTLEDQVGIIGGLGSALSDLREELAPIITAFGEAFAPLIEDTLDLLPNLLEQSLAAAGGVETFADTLRQFGQTAFEVIPGVVGAFFDFARTALPVLKEFIGFLSANSGRAIEGILRIVRELEPELRALGRAFVDALPELAALGTVILNEAIPALTQFIRFIEDAIQLGQASDGIVDFIETAVQRAIAWAQGPGQQLASSLISRLTDALGDAFTQQNVQNLTEAGIRLLGDVLTGLENWATGDGQTRIGTTLRTLFGGVATALNTNEEQIKNRITDPIISILGSALRGIATAITSDEATALVSATFDVGQALGASIAEGTVAYITSDAFTNDIQTALVDTLTSFDVANILDRAGFGVAASTIRAAGVTEEGARQFDPSIAGPQAQLAGPAAQQRRVDVQVGVDVDEGGNINPFVEDVVERRLDRQERRTSEDRGFNRTP